MAKKRFLQENGNQVWPISRADCIYTEDGTKLLSEDYATKEEATISEDELDAILNDVFGNSNSEEE